MWLFNQDSAQSNPSLCDLGPCCLNHAVITNWMSSADTKVWFTSRFVSGTKMRRRTKAVRKSPIRAQPFWCVWQFDRRFSPHCLLSEWDYKCYEHAGTHTRPATFVMPESPCISNVFMHIIYAVFLKKCPYVGKVRAHQHFRKFLKVREHNKSSNMLQLPIRNLNIVCCISILHLMEDFSCSACNRFPISVFSANIYGSLFNHKSHRY